MRKNYLIDFLFFSSLLLLYDNMIHYSNIRELNQYTFKIVNKVDYFHNKGMFVKIISHSKEHFHIINAGPDKIFDTKDDIYFDLFL